MSEGPFALPEAEMRRLELIPFCDEAGGIAGLVAPRYGGELASLRIRWQGRWVETLYRAGLCDCNPPPPAWRGRAPLLWPAVGRSFTDEHVKRLQASGEDPRTGSYRLGDRELEMPTHGFVMDMPWEPQSLEGAPEGTVGVLTVSDTSATRAYYPFAFRLSVAYATGPGGLRATYTVEAGENHEPMPFTIGNHISLLVPLAGRGRFDEAVFHSPARAYRGLRHPSIFDGTVAAMVFSGVPLGNAAIHDMVTCGYRWDAAEVVLWRPESFGMAVGQRVLEVPGGVESLDSDETCFFVLWGSPADGYFCPEPWLGGPNALNTGKGLIRLAAGERFTWQMQLRPVFEFPERPALGQRQPRG